MTTSEGVPHSEPTTSGILKSTSAYDETGDTDSQFFPTEERPTIASLPIKSTDPTEDDYDDPDGGIFSGPAAHSVPTSYSTFRMRARSRGELDRLSREFNKSRDNLDSDVEDDDDKSRKSRKSSRSRSRRRASTSKSRSRRGSDATQSLVTETEAGSDNESTRTGSKRRRRRTRQAADSTAGSESDEDLERTGFFQSISDAIRGRPSMERQESGTSSRAAGSRSGSRAGSVYESDAVSARSESDFGDDDPYGPYGSSDTNSTSTTQTSSSQEDGPRRRRGGGGFFGLPGVAGDAMFGESRIDFDEYDDDELSSLDEPDDANRKSFSNTHQSVYIPDEDLPLRFNGLSVSTPKLALWSTGCVVSLGSLWLLGRWLPGVWLKSVGRRGEFADASYIVVEVSMPGLDHFTPSDMLAL